MHAVYKLLLLLHLSSTLLSTHAMFFSQLKSIRVFVVSGKTKSIHELHCASERKPTSVFTIDFQVQKRIF